jgi:hypothetical protein
VSSYDGSEFGTVDELNSHNQQFIDKHSNDIVDDIDIKNINNDNIENNKDVNIDKILSSNIHQHNHHHVQHHNQQHNHHHHDHELDHTNTSYNYNPNIITGKHLCIYV